MSCLRATAGRFDGLPIALILTTAFLYAYRDDATTTTSKHQR